MKKSFCVVIIIFLLISFNIFSLDKIRIGTWNIEHLSGSGRGLGGIGAGVLPKRSEEQLKEIANLIKNELKIDILAIQEVAINSIIDGKKISDALEVIRNELGYNWAYIIGESGLEDGISLDLAHNLQCAYIWNTNRAKMIKNFSLKFTNEVVGSKSLYDRLPFVVYFEALKNDIGTNDFLLINVHLASGQDNDENHLAAMIIIEQNIKNLLKNNHFKESDRIILGDFNDNPYTKENGEIKYSDFLYKYMEWKGYTDLVTRIIGSTRMDEKLESIIDHILINKGIHSKHLVLNSFKKYMPSQNHEELAEWRKTFSDHFPLYFDIKVSNSDDDVD